MPLFGAWVADQYWGRVRTIFASIAMALIGHSVLVISAIPHVIASPGGSIACFTIGLIIMGVGTGGFKYVHISNLAVLRLTASQIEHLPSDCGAVSGRKTLYSGSSGW